MNKTFLNKIQKQTEDLLNSNNLKIASKDQCSEMARLVGCWISEEKPRYKIQILKGGFSNGSAHDILAAIQSQKLFLIDPTIWQFFPRSKSIFLGSMGTISEALKFLHQKYSGVWNISEFLGKCDDMYQKKLLKTINKNKKTIKNA